ncbi:L,D-transpeptidase family protein [Verrucomicrobiaceae bacterium 227]
MKVLLLLLCPFFLVSCGFFGGAGYAIKKSQYRATTPGETTLKISLWDQKAWLLNGAGVAVLEADVATGVPGKDTPVGVFPVLERIEEKRSNAYGRLVDIESRKIVVEKAWEHKGPLPEGTEYEGIAMPYWMRLTWDGVGMHVGKFNKRTRSSFGCIRVYEKAQPLIFAKTKMGTAVEIVPGSLMSQYAW